MQQHLETCARISEIFIFKFVGISSLGLDSVDVITRTGLDSETPATGTEVEGDPRGVAV